MRRIVDFRNGWRVGGHPLHVLLIHFPLALWSLVFPLEVAAWFFPWEEGWRLAYLANAAGSLASLPALVAGLPDLLALSDRPEASALANRHMLVMLGAATAFSFDLYWRWGAFRLRAAGAGVPEGGGEVIIIMGLSLAGLLLLTWGGWMGGELVFRHGAGQSRQERE